MNDLFDNRRIVLHPGFVKSATTSLQELVFSRHPEIGFFGPSVEDKGIAWAIRHLCNADSSHYREDDVRRIFTEAIMALPADKVVVISHENFTLYEATDKGIVAERLHALFPNAAICFTLRRQDEVLAGWYLQKLPRYLRGKHYLSFREWLRLKRKEPHKSILNDLDYHASIGLYVRRFGREKVGVFLFEELRRDPSAFSAALAGFLQVDAETFRALMASETRNAGISKEYVLLMRTLGRLLPARVLRYLSHRIPKHLGRRLRVRLPQAAQGQVAALCAEGNRALAKDFAVDLEAYGYPV